MIKKKIYILTLTLVFLVSTTGMPFFYHYCEFIGKKSLNECNDCIVEEEIETSCCNEEILISNRVFSSQNSSCCIDQFDFIKVDDVFSQSFNPVFYNLILLKSECESELLDSENKYDFNQYNNFSLPPPKSGKELLHSIHQLKIDTPIC